MISRLFSETISNMASKLASIFDGFFNIIKPKEVTELELLSLRITEAFAETVEELNKMSVNIRDLRSKEGINVLSVELTNRTRKDISVTDIYIEQYGNMFKASHERRLFRKIYDGISFVKDYTMQLPVNIPAYNSVSGIIWTLYSTVKLFAGYAKLILYSSRGKILRNIYIGEDGSLSRVCE